MKPLIALLLMFTLSGCVGQEGIKDEARSRAFTKILESKKKKAQADFDAGKIKKAQLEEYEALIKQLLKLEEDVLSGN